jgi:hypothetical protein
VAVPRRLTAAAAASTGGRRATGGQATLAGASAGSEACGAGGDGARRRRWSMGGQRNGPGLMKGPRSPARTIEPVTKAGLARQSLPSYLKDTLSLVR